MGLIEEATFVDKLLELQLGVIINDLQNLVMLLAFFGIHDLRQGVFRLSVAAVVFLLV